MLKNRFTALATAGLASALALGLSACGDDTEPDDDAAEAERAPECGEMSGSNPYVHDNLGQLYASPIPTGLTADASEGEFRDESTEYSSTNYVIGWQDGNGQHVAESLDGVTIVAFEGPRDGPCEVIDDIEGAKVEGGDQKWELYSFVVDESQIPENTQRAYISFDNPFEEGTGRPIIELWDLSDGSIASGDISILQALGDELVAEAN